MLHSNPGPKTLAGGALLVTVVCWLIYRHRDPRIRHNI